jgi:hypothetical protein
MKMISIRKKRSTYLLAIVLLFLFSAPVFGPVFTSANSSLQENDSSLLTLDDQTVYLLRVEHYLYLNASEDVGSFHVRYSFPPDYGSQVPLMLDIHNDSTTIMIQHYEIQDNVCPPNKIINFTIKPMMKNDSILLHFSCWVIVEDNDFSNLPIYVKIPRRYQLPAETKQWLVSTKQVQIHSVLIKLKARQLHGLNNNLVRYAKRISFFIKYHRYILFVIELNTSLLLSQDARTTLLMNGENVGRSHLACAFFRTYNIPARVLLVNNDQGFWTQMHYMVEYYCPGYGWVLLDPTFGITPYATHHQIINRVCYPQDEQNTKQDYIFPFMKGEERWLWIDNDHVSPYYVDCNTGSKSQMFTESTVSSDETVISYAFALTQIVFRQYQTYLGMNLTAENQGYFENATEYQNHAIVEFTTYQDIDGYLYQMNLAYNEYLKIQL